MGIRLNKVLSKLNIGIETVVEYLMSVPGLEPTKDLNLNSKLSDSQYEALQKRFSKDGYVKAKANTLFQKKKDSKKTIIAKESPKDTFPIREQVPISILHYENHKLFYQSDTDVYVLIDGFAPAYVQSDAYLKKNTNYNDDNVIILLNRSNCTFVFQDKTLLNRLNTLSYRLTLKKDKRKNKQKTNEKQVLEETQMKDAEINAFFSSIKFSRHLAKYEYRKIVYTYRDSRFNNFDTIVRLYRNTCSQKEKEKLDDFYVTILLNKKKRTFKPIDIDLADYVLELKRKITAPTSESKFQDTVHENLPINKRLLDVSNIEFHDGFYLIWIISNGQKNLSITPLRVSDANSFSCLRHVHKYFSDRFPNYIQIYYNEHEVIGISIPYVLGDYIKTLHDNIDVRGDWWEEIQNERKPSLSFCRSTSTAIVKKKASLRSGYIDNLASMQNSQKLIPVYEINHGIQEDAFMFTVSMPKDRCAIIFENVSSEASTATEVFVTKTENYESCLNLVFDYFTDYSILTKRDSLRRGVNPPNKFMAEQFYSVVHSDLGTWIVKMNKILERVPYTSEIEFVSGLHVPHNIDSRSGHGETTPKNIHNELMRRLYTQLCKEYGADNVGTEIRIGSKRIDAVVKVRDSYNIYEIKSDTDPFTCVTIALGQICQYAYLYCRDKIGRMVIVGATSANLEVEQYLSWFRKKYLMAVYYMQI